MIEEPVPSLLTSNLVLALQDDPFYVAITEDFAADSIERSSVLRRYFEYSVQEGRRMGRCVVAADGCSGAAIWTLPSEARVRQGEAAAKQRFLVECLGPLGLANYRSIIDFMTPRAREVVGDSSWYLSIIGVDPKQQGQGFGAGLLTPTLKEADGVDATCYLETFTARNLRFYARFGFEQMASYIEPTTASRYWIMRRLPNA
jgi:GNAT superfamily N-acetyltransferase